MNEYHKISEGILGEETIEKTNTELFLSLVGQYFPEAIKDGEVDFTALKEEMGEFHEVSSEHYDFTWAGKQSAKKEAQSDIFGKTLKYKPQDSLNPDTTENIYIEGDNLEALKLLRRNYHGKIKMIYIDPPYNTGNDFVYHDNFAMTEEELANLSGDIENGVRLKKNPKDNARYHTNWLNMMYPRLKVARDLLADDGVIFISIDDNEVDNLRKTCDEVFGEKNYLNQFAWVSNITGRQISGCGAAKTWESIIVYCKNISYTYGLITNINFAKSKMPDTYKGFNKDIRVDERGEFAVGDTLYNHNRKFNEETRPNLVFSIFYNPETEEILTGDIGEKIDGFVELLPHANGDGLHKYHAWRWSRKKIAEEYYDLIVLPTSSGGYEIYTRIRDFQNTTLKDLITNISNGDTETQRLFDNRKYFDYPKSVDLIRTFIDSINDKEVTVLDFFSGSGTTAQAVMQLNAEDGGNRKYIMVQLPELTEEKSAAFKAGYENLCQLGEERIKRAVRKIHSELPNSSFDDGFKVFEVADTNIRWNTTNDEEIKLLADNDYSTGDKDNIDFTPGHNDIDIVYEIMLRQFDIPLSKPIEKLPEVSDRTYIFADAVVVCLEPEIDEKLIEKLASIEPVPGKFVLRDSAFNDDIELKDVSYRRLSALIANHQLEGERKNSRNNYTVEFI